MPDSKKMPRTSSPIHALRTLIVEDEALIALETSVHLDEWNHEVVGIATSRRQALAIASREARIDVALVDVNLAYGEDGVELARTLKQDFGIDVIFVTGFSDEVSRQRMQSVGPIACLFKPYEPAHLERVLAEAFSPVEA